MRRSALALSLLAALLLTACGEPAAPADPPADFRLRYDWRAGTMPPPYHYSYSIALTADGSGTMTMVPDYSSPEVPRWELPFSVSPEAVAALYDRLRAERVLDQPWRELDVPPVGGETRTLELTAAGRNITIPSFPVDSQRERAERVYAAIEALVPTDVRAELERRRAAYEAAYTRP